MLYYVIPLCLAIMTAALVLTLLRLIKGPDLPDRILALDTLYINAIALIVLFGIWLGATLSVIGATLGSVAVAHGNLSVSISSQPVISQPNALSTGGQTVVTEQASIQISQDKGALIQMGPAAQLSEVVKALNALGATPQDLLAILQAIKASGALNADLEVI